MQPTCQGCAGVLSIAITSSSNCPDGLALLLTLLVRLLIAAIALLANTAEADFSTSSDR
ncbi:MAG: hypothetical protein WBB28_24075 [Crinalium sp.]